MQFADPRNDIAFKKIFGKEKNKDILISFVNSVLDFPTDEQVTDIEFDIPYQIPKIEELKETVLDIIATDSKGHEFIIEMQLQRYSYFVKRSLYYTSKSYVEQLDRGKSFQKLKRVYFIGILDFHFSDKKKKDYISNHLILDIKTHENKLDDFHFCFVELPKFKKELGDIKKTSDKWIYFIKNAYLLEEVPKAYTKSKVFKKAFEEALQHKWSKRERRIYDYQLDQWRKKVDIESSAIELGEIRGEKRGEIRGEKRGIEKGIKEEKNKIALEMKKEGYTTEQIQKITKLSKKEVENL